MQTAKISGFSLGETASIEVSNGKKTQAEALTDAGVNCTMRLKLRSSHLQSVPCFVAVMPDPDANGEFLFGFPPEVRAGDIPGVDNRLMMVHYWVSDWGDGSEAEDWKYAADGLPAPWRHRNQGRGLYAGHTYYAPGTYSITVWAEYISDGQRYLARSTLSVTVVDKLAPFEPQHVLYASSSSDFSNAPAGAQTFTRVDTALVRAEEITRINRAACLLLLKAGDTFDNHSWIDGNGNYGRLREGNRGHFYMMSDDPTQPDPILQIPEGGFGFAFWHRGSYDTVIWNIDLRGTWDGTTNTGNAYGAFGSYNDNAVGGSSDVAGVFLIDGCSIDGFRTGFSGTEVQYAGSCDNNWLTIMNCRFADCRDFQIFSPCSHLIVAGNKLVHPPDVISQISRSDQKLGNIRHQTQATFGAFNAAYNWMASLQGWYTFSEEGTGFAFGHLQPNIRLNQNYAENVPCYVMCNRLEAGYESIKGKSSNLGNQQRAVMMAVRHNIFHPSWSTTEVVNISGSGVYIQDNVVIMPDIAETPDWSTSFEGLVGVGNPLVPEYIYPATETVLDAPTRIERNMLVSLCTGVDRGFNSVPLSDTDMISTRGGGDGHILAHTDLSISDNFGMNVAFDTPQTEYGDPFFYVYSSEVYAHSRVRWSPTEERPQYASPAVPPVLPVATLGDVIEGTPASLPTGSLDMFGNPSPLPRSIAPLTHVSSWPRG